MKKILITILFITSLFLCRVAVAADAAPPPVPRELHCICANNVAKDITAVSCPLGCDEGVALQNPIGGTKDKPAGTTDINIIIGNVIKGALGIIGALTLFMFVWGGATWLTSAGNPEKIKSGAQTMIFAAVGVLIVFISYIVVNAVLSTLEWSP